MGGGLPPANQATCTETRSSRRSVARIRALLGRIQSKAAAGRESPSMASTCLTTSVRAASCQPGMRGAARQPFAERLLAWMELFWGVRCMGGCMDALMVARGQAEIWIETGGKPWDFAPLKIIAEEAGARFFAFDGKPTIYGGNCVICTPPFEDTVRQFLKNQSL